MYSLSRLFKAAHWIISSNPYKRRRVRQECARIAASLFGDFPLSDDYKLWREDKQFLSAYKKLSPRNPYSQDRKYVLKEFTKYVATIEGDLAECGCFEGASAFFIASEAPDICFHIFDSFEGLSQPDAYDNVNKTSSNYWKAGDLSSSTTKLRDNLSRFKNIVLHKGWIPSRFIDVELNTFRLVHIDVDLYQPTIDSLDFFYPRLNKGGVIIMDDYGATTCPGAFKAANDYMKDKIEHIIHLPTAQGIIIKQ